MTSIRNRAFAALTALFLVGPAVAMGLHGMHVPLPSAFDTGQAHMHLEGRNAQGMPDCGPESLLDGTFQEETELFMADHVPLHDQALEASAALQRASIAQSARVMGYDVYPSYFGSIYLYEPGKSAVWHMPNQADPEAAYEPRMHTFGEGIAAVAARHPETRFCLVVPAGGATPAMNPAYPLMANPQYPEPLLEVLREELADVPNVVLVSNIGDYDDEEDYFQEYFRTDHHWNPPGSARLYNQAAEALDLALIHEQPTIELGRNMGSYARNGLVPVDEKSVDIDEQFPGVCLIDPETGTAVPVDEHRYYDPSSPEGYYDFYNRYYRQVEYYTGPGSGTAMLICDSFAAPMIAPIAANYETTHRIGDLYQKKQGNPSLEALIDEQQPNDVWIVGIPADLMSLVSRVPGYFDE